VDPAPLDPNTADRILAGAVAPEDAPPGYAEVTRLLDAACAEETADAFADEERIVPMMAALVRSSSSNPPHSSRRHFERAFSRRRVAAALVAAGLFCWVGFASGGTMLGAVAELVSATLATLEVSDSGRDEEAIRPETQRTSGDPRLNEGRAGNAPAIPKQAARAEGGNGSRASMPARDGDGDGDGERRRPASEAPLDGGNVAEHSRPATVPSRVGVEQRTTNSAAASRSESQAGERHPAQMARRPAPRSGGGKGTSERSRKHKSSTGAPPAKRSEAARASGTEARARQTGAEQNPGPGNGGSVTPGNGQQGGNPPTGGGGPGGSGNGSSGHNGRP
jgi:hypothetical protein